MEKKKLLGIGIAVVILAFILVIMSRPKLSKTSSVPSRPDNLLNENLPPVEDNIDKIIEITATELEKICSQNPNAFRPLQRLRITGEVRDVYVYKVETSVAHWREYIQAWLGPAFDGAEVHLDEVDYEPEHRDLKGKYITLEGYFGHYNPDRKWVVILGWKIIE